MEGTDMTNAMIILNESIALMEQGVLQGVGPVMKVTVIENDEEVEKEMQLPESIHTYEKWKQLGYQVRKGEKAIASFPVWKMTKPSKKAQEEAEKNEETAHGHMFLKQSSFFKMSQVDKIESTPTSL
jgi:antirestriction protein ArdC